MSGKKCDKCGQPFKGFGTTCGPCRKGVKAGGQPKDCEKCGSFFIGFGDVCSECQSGKGPGRTGVRAPTPEEVDHCLDRIDACIQKVDASQQSVVRLRKNEFDLLAQLEIVRDIIQRILKSGNRQLLKTTFVDCGRVARLTAFLGQINLSDMNKKDQRLKDCEAILGNLTDVVEKDMGMGEQLKEAAETASTGLLMKRVSFLMDEEKVAAHQAEVDSPPPARPGAKGPGGYPGSPQDPMSADDDVDDNSDWEDEDFEEMPKEQADSLWIRNARILFDELDVNKDGALSKEEVLNGASELRGLLKACKIHKRKHVINMFKEGDIDNDGTLDFQEFMNYLHAARQKAIEAQTKKLDDVKVKKVFDMMDRDGDGSLTCEELKLAYGGVLLMAGEVVDAKRTSSWASRNFKKYDTDGSGTLDLGEFKLLLQNSGALAPMLDFADGTCVGCEG